MDTNLFEGDLQAATLDVNRRLVERLYDEKRGYYLLMQLVNGEFVPIRPLTRDEALIWYCARDEVLRHVYPAREA